MRRLLQLLGLTLLVAGWPASAHAHLVNTRLGDFYGGMLHPLTGVGDILPWLALAVLAAFQTAERARWVVVMFPLALFAGTASTLLWPSLPFVPYAGIALIAIVGLAVAAGIRLPVLVLAGLGVIVALVDGYQNGQAMVPSTDHWLFISGVAMIGYVVMTLVVALTLAFLKGRGGWREIALRAGGSWIAAVGIMALGLQLAMPATS